jgi:prepilin-type N-terminal cleavage/methylation domain-containing protein
MTERAEGGFTIIEVLVALTIFSLIAAAFMSVLFAVARGTDSTAAHVRISEEARLGLNRMIRDTREAGWISLTDPSATATSHDSFTVKIDFDGDGAYTNPASGTAQGNYEVLTYAYDDATDRITVTVAGVGTETLIAGVDCIRDETTNACTSDVFSFTSNRLEYDWGDGAAGPPDGVTSLVELNATACPPNGLTTLDNCNGTLADGELANITSLNIALSLGTAERKTPYYAEAQLRNRR